jgi:hypothetical protein
MVINTESYEGRFTNGLQAEMEHAEKKQRDELKSVVSKSILKINRSKLLIPVGPGKRTANTEIRGVPYPGSSSDE